MKYPVLVSSIILLFSSWASAEVSLPSLFTDHMVLQRNLADPVWGKASPGEVVKVEINGQSLSTTADSNGDWRVTLAPMEAGGPYTMTVTGENTVTIKDILVGEVWICSGQSNMRWSVERSYNSEVEVASATNPMIRLITVPNKGTQEPQYDFEGKWEVCSPGTVKGFSAVGYFFGRRLQETLGVPVGLINNAWGGSAAEAWVPRDVLAEHGGFDEYLTSWEEKTGAFTDEDQQAKVDEYKAALAEWEKSDQSKRKPRWPEDPRYGKHRPGNIYNGELVSTIGYGIQGVIWYQGETNGSRYDTYDELFPLLITTWREKWGQGDFPFYWVQLADYRAETDDANKDSQWARLRETQTMTLDAVSNGGQAVIIDIGEGRDIHPRNKQDVANRLARWALAKDYGYDIAFQSPTFESMKVDGNKVVLEFDSVSGGGLYAFDTREVKGFAIAGEDQQFHWAEAEIQGGNTVVVWSDAVESPVAVRYGWADNPVVNLFDKNGLPVTPFRTDDWPYVKDSD